MSSKPEEGAQKGPWTGETKQKFETYAAQIDSMPTKVHKKANRSGH